MPTYLIWAFTSSRRAPLALLTVQLASLRRQPIFDRQEHVYGYELLFRSGLENRYTGDDADAAARDVADNFLNAGARTLTAGRKAFINCTRQFLVNEYATLLPKAETVIEILETIEPDAEVLAACRRLKDLGYMIALDDFVYSEKFQPFVELADIIKIDFKLSAPGERQRAVAEVLAARHPTSGGKGGNMRRIRRSSRQRLRLLPGLFLLQATDCPQPHIPAFKLHYLRILQAINKPELDRSEIAALIDREVSLCYKLLRFMNSPLFGFRREISSTGHALAMLGDRELRKWASIAAVLGIAGDKPNELVLTALTRGRCCELLAANQGRHVNEPEPVSAGSFLPDGRNVGPADRRNRHGDRSARRGSSCPTRKAQPLPANPRLGHGL